MSEDQYIKLFAYMTDRFDDLERRLESKADKSDVDRIVGSIDGIIARLDNDDTERAAILHQLQRHEGWIFQLAKNTSTQLS